MKSHPLTQKIPEYLRPYIAKQDASLYTAMDHASWRFILKISKNFFAEHAHQKYLDGLRETGISTEKIPLISEMNVCLKKFNWQAVPVIGFIPPAVFMEFLSLGILPIACDMRTLEHLAYTPAPDIVHEAAGHAPIIADPEYSDYLRSYGEISQKAIFSSQDMDVYNAIRFLSDIKEDPHSSSEQIQAAEDQLDQALASQTYESEATLLSRMGWWTFEYGMVGELSKPKIYGAGLLSSLGESYHCMDSSVKKIPFSIDCIEMSYDITRPQPQLYVASDFQVLKDALEELANKMAFRIGGLEGLERAKKAKTTTTIALDSGVEVSGVLGDFLKDHSDRPIYVQFQGPTQISYEGQEILGQGPQYHSEGFGSPLENITDIQLQDAGLAVGQRGQLILKSGITVEGKLVDILKKNGKIILLTFEDCVVQRGSEFLFRPEWGKFDMICGEKILSVFGGPSDRKKYLEGTGNFHQEPGCQKTNLTDANRELNELYQEVRNFRENFNWDASVLSRLSKIHQALEDNYPKDWLLRFELLELNQKFQLKAAWENTVRTRLKEISTESLDQGESIRRGVELLDQEGISYVS